MPCLAFAISSSPKTGPQRASGRDPGAHGLQTLRRLLAAGLTEFCDKGYQAVRIDDIVCERHRLQAKTSHGTFYLYFDSKDDLFSALLRDVLQDMRALAWPRQAARRPESCWPGCLPSGRQHPECCLSWQAWSRVRPSRRF
ncbi:MAG: TetR/AcrR family transcriptional regulator [Streptosporangiaceae bacterium]